MRGQFDTREARQWTTGTVWKMQPQLRNARNHQKLKEARNRFLETLRSVALSISWVWPNDTVSSSGLQSCERINFCGFSHWLYDNLLQQAQETNALPTGQGELVSLLLTNATSGLAFVRLPHGGAAPRTAGEASQQQASSPAFRSVLRHISTYLHASMYVYSYMHAHTHTGKEQITASYKSMGSSTLANHHPAWPSQHTSTFGSACFSYHSSRADSFQFWEEVKRRGLPGGPHSRVLVPQSIAGSPVTEEDISSHAAIDRSSVKPAWSPWGPTPMAWARKPPDKLDRTRNSESRNQAATLSFLHQFPTTITKRLLGLSTCRSLSPTGTSDSRSLKIDFSFLFSPSASLHMSSVSTNGSTST